MRSGGTVRRARQDAIWCRNRESRVSVEEEDESQKGGRDHR